jgi:hypothetical protein
MKAAWPQRKITMYPSTEKPLIDAMRHTLKAFDSGEPGADAKLANLARAAIAVADSDDEELVRLQVNAAVLANAVPQSWLGSFIQACKMDGMSERDVRASAIGIWHAGDIEWQEARRTTPAVRGECDGTEHAIGVNKFIRDRDRMRALDPA